MVTLCVQVKLCYIGIVKILHVIESLRVTIRSNYDTHYIYSVINLPTIHRQKEGGFHVVVYGHQIGEEGNIHYRSTADAHVICNGSSYKEMTRTGLLYNIRQNNGTKTHPSLCLGKNAECRRKPYVTMAHPSSLKGKR